MSATQEEADFVPKTLKLSVWGMDSSSKPFVVSAKTLRIARRAAEVDCPRQLSLGEIVGVGYNGMKSRFRVTSSFISGSNTFRVILEDLGNSCMWPAEMQQPDAQSAKQERRQHERFPCMGQAFIFDADGAHSTEAKMTDVSRGGAYIETYSPSPVGTQLTARFSLGVEFTAAFKVCTSHSSIGMGVQFVKFASGEDEQRFQGMIAQIEQAAMPPQ